MEKLAKIFICLSKLEREVYEVYHKLSIRTVNKHAGWIMEFIALDSWKHYLLYNEMCGRITGEKTIKEEVDCESLLGKMFMETLEVLSRIKNDIEEKESLSSKEIMEYLKRFAGVEETAGEEIYVELVAKLLSKSSTILEKKGIVNVMRLIGEDEERHLRLLDQIKEIISKDLS